MIVTIMYVYILGSIFLGLCVGFLYGVLFLKKLNNLFSGNNIQARRKPSFLSFSFFSMISFILLICILILFVLEFKLNLLIVFVFLLLAFWVTIIKNLNKVGQKK